MRNRGFGTNTSEQEVYERLKKTFDDVLHIGIPDFLCLKDGKLTFVEAKHGYARLSEDQKKAHEILKKHRFDVRVERTPIRKHPHLYEMWLINNPADRVLSTPCQDNPDQITSHQSRSQHVKPRHDRPCHHRSNQNNSIHYIPLPSISRQVMPAHSRTNPITPHRAKTNQYKPDPHQPKGGKEK